MDELLRQVLTCVGITYLVIRFGKSTTSLVNNLVRYRASREVSSSDTDLQ